MKKLIIILFLALIGSVLLGGVGAKSNGALRAVSAQDSDVFTHKEAGVQFVLPKGWKAQPDGEVITVSTADDSLQIVFWVPDDATFDAAVKDLDNELGKTIKKIKTTSKPTQDT